MLVLGSVGEKRTVYDYVEDVEVRLYQVKEGAKAVVVDGEGVEVGTIEVGSDGGLKEQKLLKGKWEVVKSS